MTPQASFDCVAEWLRGRELSHLWRGYGSALFLEFGALTPRLKHDGSPGHPDGILSLMIQWSWRIEDVNSIICGSWSDEDRWQPAFDLLRKRRVVELTAFGRLMEIVLEFDGGHRLTSFSTTDGQPQWAIIDRRSPPDKWLSVRDGCLHEGDGSEPAI